MEDFLNEINKKSEEIVDSIKNMKSTILSESLTVDEIKGNYSFTDQQVIYLKDILEGE